jgi:hypothetical protein
MGDRYRIRFIDGPNKGERDYTETLDKLIVRYQAGQVKGVNYYRLDDPQQELREYRYSRWKR